MSEIALKVENLSKQYRLGLVGTGTISHDLNRLFARWRGKRDPTLKIGQENQLSEKGGEYVWALQDINFDVRKGEVLGIIGKNGAGKSTLLKVLSKVTAPTKGRIKANGRIASLLEVGTGFHPELTGRENIFLNGAILGMHRSEIKAKLDEIVDFAGVGKYLDTPVKRYSSGMYVRLAFAVAAFLEPDILIVDEVLAVGDAEFQKKAIGKMKDVSKGEGRTVLFVSHNMGLIQNLCHSVVFLQEGKVLEKGATNIIIQQYLNTNFNHTHQSFEKAKKRLLEVEDNVIKFLDLKIYQDKHSQKLESSYFDLSKPIYIQFTYELKKEMSGLRVGLDLKTIDAITIFRTFHDDNALEKSFFPIGRYVSTACIPPNFLMNKNYIVYLSVGVHAVRWILFEDISFTLEMSLMTSFNQAYADKRNGLIMPLIEWENQTHEK